MRARQLVTVAAPEMQALARKLEPLMKSAGAHSERSPLDFLLGALQGLMHAKHLRYDHRPQPLDDKYWAEGPLVRVRLMGDGQLDVEGKWLAGFYFNSALVRLAAAFDRVVRFKATQRGITIKEHRVWDLLRDLGLHRFTGGKLAKVYTEVNPLKHEPEGLDPGRRVTLVDATEAFDEMLDLVSA